MGAEQEEAPLPPDSVSLSEEGATREGRVGAEKEEEATRMEEKEEGRGDDGPSEGRRKSA